MPRSPSSQPSSSSRSRRYAASVLRDNPSSSHSASPKASIHRLAGPAAPLIASSAPQHRLLQIVVDRMLADEDAQDRGEQLLAWNCGTECVAVDADAGRARHEVDVDALALA